MIEFNKPSITDVEKKLILEALEQNKLCGDGPFTKKVNKWFKDRFNMDKFLLTTSCSHALELSALLCNIKPGDEVIVPSYTFVTTVSSFVLRGAIPVFIDINPRTMNMDENLIEERITSKTKAIVPVHYAGVACNMDKIMEIAKKHNLLVVEDAAQAVGSKYNNIPLGTIGDFGCFSFHETKNYSMGEGGAIIVKDEKDFLDAEILREKGTNRSQFMRGQIDKYTWHKIGSSYLPSDILAALLYGQLIRFDEIMEKRLYVWDTYHKAFEELEKQGKVVRPYIPENCTHNAHMYYLILENNEKRNNLIDKLRENNIMAPFHYIPLHSSPAVEKLGIERVDLPITDEYAGRLVRLPLHAEMKQEEIETIYKAVTNYF